jgi:hypothetical protein
MIERSPLFVTSALDTPQGNMRASELFLWIFACFKGCWMLSERVRMAPSEFKTLSTIPSDSLKAEFPSEPNYGAYIASFRLKPLNTNARVNLNRLEISGRI